MISINQRTLQWCEQNAIPAHFVAETSSTNTWAKSDFSGATPLAVYLADHQTAGRGRGLRTWSNSDLGATLLSTWCLRLEVTPQPIFSIRVGLLLRESLRTAWPAIPWAIKAPNDIHADNGKFAGILIEVEQRGTQAKAFIGIGANILTAPAGVDQETFALASKTAVTDQAWGVFCQTFTRGLLNLSQDAGRSGLTLAEIQTLEAALELFPGSQVAHVLPDGGLVLKNDDRIHWNEL